MDTSHCVEATLWHPVAAAAELEQGPRAVTLLGEDLVAWRDDQGRARVFVDRCPHRGARLSLGSVQDGRLACPYHGWQFEGSGRCSRMPAQPGFEPPASHAARSVEACEAHGLVWARLQAGSAALPDFAAAADTRLRQVLCGPYDVATSAPRIVENFLDQAHFPFVHDGWLGEAGVTETPPCQAREDAAGVHVTGCRAWQPRSNRLSTEGSWVSYDYSVIAPYTAVLHKAPDAQAGHREAIALFVCPMTPEHSRVWFVQATADGVSGDADLRAFQDAIFGQDKPVLESQRPRLLPLSEAASALEVHGVADLATMAYRRWLRRTGVRFGTC